VRVPVLVEEAAPDWPEPTRCVGAVRLVTAPRESAVAWSTLEAPDVLPFAPLAA
jgi:hypothetical protein